MLALDFVIQQFAEAVRRSVVQLRRANVDVRSCTPLRRRRDHQHGYQRPIGNRPCVPQVRARLVLGATPTLPRTARLASTDRDGLRFGLVDLGLDEVEANLRTCPACRSFDKVQLANTPCSQFRRRSLGHDTCRLHPPYSHVVAKVSARKRNAGSDHTHFHFFTCEDWSKRSQNTSSCKPPINWLYRALTALLDEAARREVRGRGCRG